MSTIAIIRLLLGLAGTLADIVREKQLMDAGEARATAKSLALLSQRLKISNEVVEEVAAMSDEELDEELRGD